jgi:eukaryotic-like serine/threonine-protein kinase
VQAPPNDVLAGKYRITRRLGEGGMGIVAEAVHLGLGHRVALKLLRSELVRPEHRERFFREARAAGSLRSEHVVAIKDVDTLPDGTPFLVMEYLEGADLGRVVQQRGALPAEEATDYVLQACHALAEAHGCGIVHRDLKPANLFLTRRLDGAALVKVLDFGIAKVAGAEMARDLTATSQYMGSPSYMSPEQVRSAKRVDARTDLWALGVILYELLVGVTPFDGETAGDVFVKISTEPPRTFPPGMLAPGLEAIILRCLEKDPERRYRDVAELAAALLPFAGVTGRARAEAVARIAGRELPAVPGPAPRAAPSMAATITTLGLSAGQSQALSGRPRRGGRNGVIAAVAILIVGAAATAGYLTLAPSAGSETPAATSPASPATAPASSATAPASAPAPTSSEPVAPRAVVPSTPPDPPAASGALPSPPAAPAAPVEQGAATPATVAAPAAGAADAVDPAAPAPPRKGRKPGQRTGAKRDAKPAQPDEKDGDFIEDRR